jgi:hypothetical protein
MIKISGAAEVFQWPRWIKIGCGRNKVRLTEKNDGEPNRGVTAPNELMATHQQVCKGRNFYQRKKRN